MQKEARKKKERTKHEKEANLFIFHFFSLVYFFLESLLFLVKTFRARIIHFVVCLVFSKVFSKAFFAEKKKKKKEEGDAARFVW